MRALREILNNLDSFRSTFISIFIVGVLSAGSSFLIPVMLSEFTTNRISNSELLKFSLIVIGLYCATLPLQWLIRRFGEALGGKYAVHLRLKYFRQLEAQPVQQLASHHSGYVLSLMSGVADGLAALSVEILWGLTYVVTNLSLFLYFTARQSSLIAGLNSVLLIVFVIFGTVLAQKVVPLMRALNLKRAAMFERYADFAANALTVKRLALYPFVEAELEQRGLAVYGSIDNFQKFHANRWLILHTLFGLAYLSTILFLLWQIKELVAAPAILILFVASYATVRGNIERLAENLKSVIEMNASLETLDEILPPLKRETEEELPTDWKEISLTNIKFTHPQSSICIRVPDFSLRRGEKVLISGPSGEGKTTLLNIIAGFYEHESGRRSIDGKDYTTALARRSVFISQDAELFNMSLAENMLLGSRHAPEKLDLLMQRLDLHSWSQHLKEGLHNKVGERGLRVSAGQRQRVNLLRGLLLDREIYFLDEPTSHLDRVTERRVIELLREHLKEKTVLIVSHRESVECLCSRRYDFKDHTLLPAILPGAYENDP